jgi:hypothetical protein
MNGTRKSNLLEKITVLVFICFFILPAHAKYGGGTGEPNDPYLIYTAEQMNSIGADQNDWDKHFKLMADIDLSACTGTSFNIIGYYVSYSDKKPFAGVFDGNGHTISNFSYTSTGINYIGLFRYVSGINGEIKDLGLIESNVNAGTRNYVGSLVGCMWGGTITNCYVHGGSVSGAGYVGGLVGYNRVGTITNCNSTSSVSGNEEIGGLVGLNSGTIKDSYSTGSVSGDSSVGGLMGGNGGTIINCYSIGSVSGTIDAGGLVGRNSSGTINKCYSTGSVSGTRDVGGLVGENYKGTVTTSFWDIETSGKSTSEGGMGLSTADMQTMSTFTDAGWDFVGEFENGPSDLWAYPLDGGYPILWWQLSPLPLLPTFSGGSGTKNDPYLISTTTDLNRIGHSPRLMRAHFKSIRDIDLAGLDIFIIGDEEYPYRGVFDGNGHTISNFTHTSINRNYVGLFALVSGINAEIKNLGLIDPNIDAGTGYSVGSMVGLLRLSTITNCYVEGGSVAGGKEVGGLVGENWGTMTNSYSEVCVSGDKYVGGLVGFLNQGATIINCYSTGSVSGEVYIGGLVGYNDYYSIITNCYSTGSVSGNYGVSGVVGNDEGEVYSSFWDIETSGQTTSAKGTGKTTAQMQTPGTFTAWGCDSIWTIDSGKDYPRLWWQNIPGEIISKPYYGGGNGGPNDPYLIYTAEQLNTIGLATCDWDKHFLLCADIDMSSLNGTSFNIIGTYWGNPFTGVFDGNGHTISNFNYTSTYTDYVGLFGYVRGVIKNLGLIDPNVNAGTGDCVGSLIGQVSGGAITGCYVKGGRISGDNYVGGLVGYNGGTITNCYSTASVLGYRYVGGLMGSNSGTITNCYSTASVLGDRYVGGLVGLNRKWCIRGTPPTCYYGTITNCYSTGSVSGGYRVGGLVGSNDGEVSASFWDIETSGQDWSDGGTGLTTTEMQMAGTFTDAGWDFVGETVNGIEDIWFIPQQDYPHLWWEGMQVPMKLTPRTLNCRSYGNWVKAHLTLPQGFTVADVDLERPAVLHSFGFESAPLYVFVNKDKLVEIEAAFERQAVCSLAGDWPGALTVAGFLTDGNIFLGTSKVRINHPGMKEIEQLALYWLNEDCVQPGWCDQIDMNRDSLVNLLDYALLMNINVEFVTDE